MLAVVPAPLLGGLLMTFGVSLLIDWLVRPFFRLQHSEYAIIVVILAVSIIAGFPAAIGVGLMAALALFAFEYARIDAVRYVTTGPGLSQPRAERGVSRPTRSSGRRHHYYEAVRLPVLRAAATASCNE